MTIVRRVRQLMTAPARLAPAPVVAAGELGGSANPAAALPLRCLHLNEGPLPPSDAALQAMQQCLAGLNRYPDPNGSALCTALAQQLGVDAARIVLGAGSNELLFTSGVISLEPGDEVVAPTPGFPSFAMAAALCDALHVGVPLAADGSVDVDATLAAITPATRLVFVSSPHNPTGGALDAARITQLVDETPAHVLLHFDEAYYEFGRHAGGPDTLALLERRTAPWISTRSFSKAYGLAGVRVGYGITHDAELARAYRAARPVFTVNAVALAGAHAALQDTAHLARLLAHTAQERARLAAALSALGCRVLPSAANFLTAVMPRSAVALAAALREHNILVSPMPWPGTPGALRIAIGTAEDSDAVCGLLKSLLA